MIRSIQMGQRWLRDGLRAALWGLVSLSALASSASAQPRYPDCIPPNTGEFIILAVSQNAESQAQLQRTIPPAVGSTICNYQNDVVTRIGAFTSLEIANSWAQYLTDLGGVSAYVVRPADRAIATNPTTLLPPPPIIPPAVSSPVTTPRPVTPTGSDLAYNPRVLGNGYAVLVSYGRNPEIATQIRQLTGREVGLVVYGQRPYLLVSYTSDLNGANALMKSLSDRGIKVFVADSRRVVLLRQAVKL